MLAYNNNLDAKFCSAMLREGELETTYDARNSIARILRLVATFESE